MCCSSAGCKNVLSFSQDMSGTIDALVGHLQDMGRTDAVNLMQIAIKEYGGSDSASANSGPMLGKWRVSEDILVSHGCSHFEQLTIKFICLYSCLLGNPFMLNPGTASGGPSELCCASVLSDCVGVCLPVLCCEHSWVHKCASTAVGSVHHRCHYRHCRQCHHDAIIITIIYPITAISHLYLFHFIPSHEHRCPQLSIFANGRETAVVGV